MPFDFASIKKSARRVVHTTLAVQAFYEDNSVNEPVEIRARWHNKIDRFGDSESAGYAEIVQGVDRIVLFPEDTPDLEFKRGGVITFPAYNNSFKLDHCEPSNGPLQQIWIAVAS